MLVMGSNGVICSPYIMRLTKLPMEFNGGLTGLLPPQCDLHAITQTSR